MALGTPAKLLALAGIGLGGYLGYTQWYVPMRLREQALARARAYQAQNPHLTLQQSLQQVGAQACNLVAMSYGVPPNPLTGALCNLASGTAVNIAKGLPGLGLTAGKGVVQVVASPFKAVTHEVTGAVKDVGNFFKRLF